MSKIQTCHSSMSDKKRMKEITILYNFATEKQKGRIMKQQEQGHQGTAKNNSLLPECNMNDKLHTLTKEQIYKTIETYLSAPRQYPLVIFSDVDIYNYGAGPTPVMDVAGPDQVITLEEPNKINFSELGQAPQRVIELLLFNKEYNCAISGTIKLMEKTEKHAVIYLRPGNSAVRRDGFKPVSQWENPPVLIYRDPVLKCFSAWHDRAQFVMADVKGLEDNIEEWWEYPFTRQRFLASKGAGLIDAIIFLYQLFTSQDSSEATGLSLLFFERERLNDYYSYFINCKKKLLQKYPLFNHIAWNEQVFIYGCLRNGFSKRIETIEELLKWRMEMDKGVCITSVPLRLIDECVRKEMLDPRFPMEKRLDRKHYIWGIPYLRGTIDEAGNIIL